MNILPIKDFPDYFVSDTGEILSARYHPIKNKTRKIKKIKPINSFGYSRVGLYTQDGNMMIKSVHRLVAETFIPNPENKPQVNHKNGIRTDNRVENLEWVSASENVRHSYYVLHRKSGKPWLGKKGKNNPFSKIILQIKDGKVIAEFYGICEAERQTGILRSAINNCCLGLSRRSGGYVWKYKGEKIE